MIEIKTSERSPLLVFKKNLYKYMKENNLRQSQQREEVLKVLHGLSNPVTIEKIMDIINTGRYPIISYTTTTRHINFYKDIGWIIVINKVHKQYILIKETI